MIPSSEEPHIPSYPHLPTKGFRLLSSPPQLQTSIAKLAKKQLIPLTNQPPAEAKIKKLEREFSWEAERIVAVFTGIYQQGAATQQDLHTLQEAEHHLHAINNTISLLHLKESEKIEAAKSLKEALHAIDEARVLSKELQKYEKLVVQYDSAIEAWNASCYDPESKGPLLSTKELKQVFAAFMQLKAYVELPGKSYEGMLRIQELYEHEQNALEFMIENWVDHLEETANLEFAHLKQALLIKNQDVYPILRQLLGLQDQLNEVEHELWVMRPISAKLPELRPHFDQVQRYFLNQKQRATALLANYDTSTLMPCDYGSSEWKEFVKNRPEFQKGWAAKTIQKIQTSLDPASWSQGTKDIVYRASALMQLSSELLTRPSLNQEKLQKKTVHEKTIQERAIQEKTIQEKTAGTFEKMRTYFSNMFSFTLAGKVSELSQQVLRESKQIQSRLTGLKAVATSLKAPKEHIKELVRQEARLKQVESLMTNIDANAFYEEQVQEWNKVAFELKEVQKNIQKIRSKIIDIGQENFNLQNLETYLQSSVSLIPDELFQHIMGSYWGKGTGMEGYASPKVLQYLLQQVSTRVDILKTSSICGPDHEREFCRTLFEMPDQDIPLELFSKLEQQMKQADILGQAYMQDKEAFHNLFVSKVKELHTGESFFFQGGWVTRFGGGHSVVYEVTKQPDEQFTFRMYNRGAGLEYHQSALYQGKVHSLPFSEMVNVSPHRLLSPTFTKSLYELQQSPPIHGDWGKKTIYNQIASMLQGVKSTYVYTASDLMEQLNVGHCSYLSMTALLSQHLGDVRSYSRFQLEVELKTVFDYFQQNLKQFSKDERKRTIMALGLEQLSRNIHKAYDDGVLLPTEVKWIEKKLQPLHKEVAEIKAKYQQEVTNKASEFHVAKASVAFTAVSKSRFFQNIDVQSLKTHQTVYHSVDGSSYVYKKETFREDLAQFLQKVVVARNEKGGDFTLNIKDGIQAFVSKIPIEGDVFWKELSTQEGRFVLEDLARLSEEYVSSIGNKCNPKISDKDCRGRYELTPEEMLSQAKLVTLVDAMAHHFAKDWGFTLPVSICQSEMRAFIEGKIIYTSPLTPKVADEMRLLRHYWENVDPLKGSNERLLSFFGFEVQPADSLMGGVKGRRMYVAEDDIKNHQSQGGYFRESEYPWPDVQFALNWLEKPQEMAKFDQQYPEFKDSPPIVKAACILSDEVWDKEKQRIDHRPQLLPPEFFTIRDIAFHVQFLLKGAWNGYDPYKYTTRLFNAGSESDPVNALEIAYSRNVETYDRTVSQGVENAPNVNQFEERFRGFIAGKNELAFDDKNIEKSVATVFWDNYQKVLGEHYNERLGLYRYGARKRVEPHARQNMRPDLKALNAISSVPELQIQETFTFFQKNTHLLREPDYQNLFFFLFSEKGLLIDELLRSPQIAAHFAGQFAGFCKGQMDFALSVHDATTLNGLLDVALFFDSNVQYIQKQYPGSFPKDFVNPMPDLTMYIKAVLRSKDASEDAKSKAAYLLIKAYSSSEQLSVVAVSDIFEALVQLTKSPPETWYLPKEWLFRKIFEKQLLLRKIRGPLEKALQSTDASDYLNAIAKRLNPQFTRTQWKPADLFPRFIASDGVSMIDVVEGKILIKGQGLSRFPHYLQNHQVLKSISRGSELKATEVEPNKYVFGDREGRACRLAYLGNTSPIQREIDGRWYQAVVNPNKEYQELPFHQLFRGCIAWVNDEDPNDKTILLFDEASDTFQYRVTIKNESDSTVEKLNPDGSRSGLILEDIYGKSHPYRVLERFEDNEYTFVWKEKAEAMAKRIEFSDFNLAFEVQGEKAYLKQLPGYYLAKKQHIPALGDVSTYLVVEKEARPGEYIQAVIMPQKKFQTLSVPRLTTPTMREEREPGVQKYVVLDVHSKTGELVPRTREGRFYAAYVFLWERDYKRAAGYLRGFGAELKALTPEELFLLSWIENHVDTLQDSSPDALSCRLLTAIIKLRNRIDFEKTKVQTEENQAEEKKKSEAVLLNKEWETVKNQYDRYLQMLDQVGVSQITAEEELLLLKYMPDRSLLAEERFEIRYPEEYGTIRQQSKEPQEFMSGLSFFESISEPENTWWKTHESFIEKLKGKPDDEGPRILARGLLSHFKEFYTLFYERKREEALPKIYHHYHGINPPPDMSLEELSQEVTILLWASRKTNTLQEERCAAGLLGAMLSDASWMPSLEKLLDKDTALYAINHAQNWNPFTHLEKAKTTRSLSSHTEVVEPVFVTASSSVQTSADLRVLEQTFEKLQIDIDPYLTVKEPSQESKDRSQQTTKELQELFDIDTGDAVADRKFKELREQIALYAKEEAKVTYEIKDFKALHSLKVHLEEEAKEMSDFLAAEYETLLALANKPYADPVKEAARQLKIQGNLEKKLTLSELYQLLRSRDREALFYRNPSLSVADIDQILTRTMNFLQLAVHRQHDLRIVQAIRDIEKVVIVGMEKERDLLVQNLGTLLRSSHAFVIATHPDYLNLEHLALILIRGDQIVDLDKLSVVAPRGKGGQENGVALEAIPGKGKTSVLLTLKTLSEADGKHCTIIVIPESLMPSQSVDIQKRWAGFEQTVEFIQFDRGDDFSVGSLQRIQDRLKNGIQNRKALLITDSSIQNLFLKFVEKITQFSRENTAADVRKLLESELHQTFKKEVSLFLDIFRTLRTVGVATIDEMDLVFDILMAHLFTIGESKPAHEDTLEASVSLYNFIASSDEIQKTIRFAFLPDKGGAPFDPTLYEEQVQPMIIKAIVEGKMDVMSLTLSQFIASLTTEQKELLTHYLHNREEPGVVQFYDQISSTLIKNRLAVLKEQITRILPLTSGKKVNLHYGDMPKDVPHAEDEDLIAIPYHGPRAPMVKSRFGTVLEAVDYSLQKPLPKEVIQKEIDLLKNEVARNVKGGTLQRIEESPAIMKFQKMCGGVRYNLFELTSEQIDKITAIVNTLPLVKFELARRFVLPQIKEYAVQLQTNGLIYSVLFLRISGFAGMLWNEESYPAIFKEIVTSDTMAKTLKILWENSSHKVKVLPWEDVQPGDDLYPKVKTVLSTLAGSETEFERSLDDVAGFFKDIPDDVVVDVMMAMLPQSKKGIAHYSPNGDLVVRLRGQKESVPIEQCGLTKEELLAYWAQKYTRGSDIRLGVDMKGYESVGSHNIICDSVQGAWRFRGLEMGQTVDFFMSDKEAKVIKSTIERITGKQITQDLELKHILLYTLYNQAMRQGDDNYRSFQHKLNMYLLNKVMEVVVDDTVSIPDAIEILIKAAPLYLNETPKEPHEQFGSITSFGKKPEVVLLQLKKVFEGSVWQLFETHSLLKQQYSLAQMKKELEEIAKVEMEKMPDTLPQQTRYNIQTSVMTETKTATKTDIKTETKTEQKNEQQTSWSVDNSITQSPEIQWDMKSIFSLSSYQTTSPKIFQTNVLGSLEVKKMVQSGITPTLNIAEVFSTFDAVNAYGDVFDPALLSTLNRMPIFHQVYSPFATMEDTVSEVILIQHKATGALQMVLGDQEDAKQFEKLLKEEAKHPVLNQEVRVCLYNVLNGEVQSGSDPLPLDSLESDPQLVKLRAQAKFYGGYLYYTEEERAYLQGWIEEKGIKRMYHLFQDTILKKKDPRFTGSDIGKIFNLFFGRDSVS